jgi:hypothetical protein
MNSLSRGLFVNVITTLHVKGGPFVDDATTLHAKGWYP